MANAVKRVQVIRATKGQNDYGKIRTAAYCRVSTDSSDQVNSFMAQMQYYNDYIRQNPNIKTHFTFSDEPSVFNLKFLFFLAVAEIFGLIAVWCTVRKNRVRSFVVIETHIFVNRLSKRFYGCVFVSV